MPNFPERNDLLPPIPAATKLDSREKEDRPTMSQHLNPTVPRPATIESPNVQIHDSGSGDLTINQYRVMDLLGRGAYGEVKLVIDINTDVKYAMKIMNKKRLKKKRKGGMGPKVRSALDDVRKECAILKKLDHPNVVNLYEIIDDETNDNLYMIFEYISRGSVMEIVENETVKPFSENEARALFRDVVVGIHYLHSVGIVHRDIKPENLLRCDENPLIKIADFGVSDMFENDNDVRSNSAGTPAFHAPETHEDNYSTKAADVFAMGVTLFCFLFGRVPWLARNVLLLSEKIQNEAYTLDSEVSPECEDLLKRILEKNPRKRITVPELLAHPWVTDNGNVNLEMETITALSVSDEEVMNAFTQRKMETVAVALSGVMKAKKLLMRPLSPNVAPLSGHTPTLGGGCPSIP